MFLFTGDGSCCRHHRVVQAVSSSAGKAVSELCVRARSWPHPSELRDGCGGEIQHQLFLRGGVAVLLNVLDPNGSILRSQPASPCPGIADQRSRLGRVHQLRCPRGWRGQPTDQPRLHLLVRYIRPPPGQPRLQIIALAVHQLLQGHTAPTPDAAGALTSCGGLCIG